MNTVKTVQINALIKAIETSTNLIKYALKDNDLDMLELYNKSFQYNMEILNSLRAGIELSYTQEVSLDGVVMAIQEIEAEDKEREEKEAKRKESLIYQGSNEAIERDGSELKPVKIKDLKLGQFFITSNKSRSVYMKSIYDRPSKKYECSNFDDISDYKYYNGNKIVYIGFTF